MGTNDEKTVLKYIRKSLSGDAKAFEWLIDKYKKRIYFSIFQIVMNHDDTDDVLQETFIKAYTKLHTYDERYPFYPWLYRIAINTSINHQKKKARTRALSLDDLEGNNHQLDVSESPRQLFESEGSELLRKLKEALAKIPTEQRTVFLLRVREQLSYQEISDALEISIGTVMSRLSRARDKLRTHLQGYLKTKDIEV
ncbi:sigma-70 family RNA polymerase sigma factor [candidate division KSB1 bacterium]|nr:sigma-70 family RNA polymerase sigma factor [candidate division KSB1 bacterium]NIR72561.1 sigma-70 family RNA polymerase sigma factor [candidate division KSB1 bacterium]NIS27313.1 sigma-70 family RNA polymerase sigma factor [candidate division KSB1 bacterium]NIT73523.1 sigma-70 family RNA polymerase sigma factor [candidate division KSB1 bacterium]NIU28043.1 sigma-70 family RNA polymerase sigma factor [candidate division KSB1 bacterium]